MNSKKHVFGKRLSGNAEGLALLQLNHSNRWFISFQSIVPSTTGILAKKLDRQGLAGLSRYSRKRWDGGAGSQGTTK